MNEQINDYTVVETFELPSKGLVYDVPVDATWTLRSMTTNEELMRLAPSEMPYKTLCDIIDRCTINKQKGVSSYNLVLGDYEFLLNKLRIVTYGPEYKMIVTCPVCHGSFETSCDLDAMDPIEYTEDIASQTTITLPRSKKEIELKFQTPKSLDNIAKRKKEILKKFPEMTTDPGFLLNLMSFIKTVDGTKLDDVRLEDFVRNLPMQDANYLLQKAIKYNGSVGLKTDFECTCKHCGFEMLSPFRLTPEFFGPTVD